MQKEIVKIEHIPAILWGAESNNVYIYAHGKLSSKEEAGDFAQKAVAKGYRVISFDLPEHGDRVNETMPCTVQNAVRDLEIVGEYARRGGRRVSVLGSSLGAYFSLLAYRDHPVARCLFLAPVLDMERLIQNMMKQAGVTESELEKQGELATPAGDMLYWDYYCYVREHPVKKWDAPTAILYGSEDHLTEYEVVRAFAERFGCDLTVMEGSGHRFHTQEQLAFLDQWLDAHI